jgi:hypothetical protein
LTLAVAHQVDLPDGDPALVVAPQVLIDSLGVKEISTD